MRAGELRHRITIQESIQTRDSDGGVVDTWGNVTTVWAAVEPQSGTESHIPDSDQLLASRMTRFRIRKRDGLNTEMRIIFGGQVFDLRQIIHVETKNREMWLIGEEINV